MDIVFILFIIVGLVIIFNKMRDYIEAKNNVPQRSYYIPIQEKETIEPVTQSHRGTRAERHLVAKLLKSGIPAQTIFHDLYLKKYKDKYSQIDLVVATKVGILVFEIKDYSGWIFGNGHQTRWTQVLAFGQQKYSFYNPILQNNKHIADLKKQLQQFQNIPFYSIIVFDGDCTLKDITFVPEGTYIVKAERVLEVMQIITETNTPAPYTNKNDVVRVLKQAVQNGESYEVQKQHVENIKDMLGEDRIFN